MGDCPRHRRRRARCDPSRRLSGSLSRSRRRQERSDAGPRREAVDSGRHARLARGEPVDVRPDNASAEGGRGRSDLRSVLPQRAGGGREIFPGQQLTATDFAATDTASVDSQITGTQRAISISIDGVHGSSSQVMPGDSVDVYLAVAGVVKLFEPNVKVLTTPTVPGPGRWRQPRHPHRDRRGRQVGLRERQRAVLVRPPPGRRCEAHEAVDRRTRRRFSGRT